MGNEDEIESLIEIIFSEANSADIFENKGLRTKPYYLLDFAKSYLEYDKEFGLVKISALGVYDLQHKKGNKITHLKNTIKYRLFKNIK